MGNKCCRNVKVQPDAKIFDPQIEYGKEFPPIQTATSLKKSSLYRVSSEQKTNSKASKLSGVSGAIYTSIIPPSEKHQHRDSVWRGLQTNSVPPSQFFVSNVKWPDRSSISNTGTSNIRFTYKNSSQYTEQKDKTLMKKSNFAQEGKLSKSKLRNAETKKQQ